MFRVHRNIELINQVKWREIQNGEDWQSIEKWPGEPIPYFMPNPVQYGDNQSHQDYYYDSHHIAATTTTKNHYLRVRVIWIMRVTTDPVSTMNLILRCRRRCFVLLL